MSIGKVKIRMFVLKNEDTTDGFEILEWKVFQDSLITGISDKEKKEFENKPVENKLNAILRLEPESKENHTYAWIEESISCVGFEIIQEDLNKILEEYENESVLEIVGDIKAEGHNVHSLDGPDWDEWFTLENAQYRKLDDSQLSFCGVKRDSEGKVQIIEDEKIVE